jgi:predicted phage terminase large subunit-like protein
VGHGSLKIQDILSAIANLPQKEQEEMLKLLSHYEESSSLENARTNFIDFVRYTWPGFIEGSHHREMSKYFDQIAQGKCKRLIINMPPRHSKSELTSIRLPAYFLGHHPNKKVILASHTADLTVGWGRKTRDLVSSEEYQQVFPGTLLKADSKAAGRWDTNKGGEYYAVGVGGALAGRGADLLIVDDPHSEQDAVTGDFNPDVWEKTWEWFNTGPRQRLQPGGVICVVMTRWHKSDVTGKLLKKYIEDEDASEWKVIELPAIWPADEANNKPERPMWPEFWTLKELQKVRADIPAGRWSAQYQQNPTSEEGAIIKRDKWRKWESGKAPDCEYILQSWDTAYGKTELANYTACTTWGVFKSWKDEDKGFKNNLILLDAWRGKIDFPEMKTTCKKLYEDWRADTLIIEAKAAGVPLIYELRAMGLPITEYLPVRGNDKIVRANAVTDLFDSGTVWYVDNRNTNLVLDECQAFPRGENDDFVDTVTQALLRFRQGGLVFSDKDEAWDVKNPRTKAAYY